MMKQEIYNWLNSGRDFVAGLALYQKYGKNKIFLRNIQNHKMRYAGKLAYELAKIAGISLEDYTNNKIPTIAIKEVKNPPAQTKKPVLIKKTVVPAAITKKEEPAAPVKIDQSLPAEVRRLMYGYHDRYTKRALLHKQLRDMPQENTPVLINQRKEISDVMKLLSDEMDVLHAARVNWEEKQILPDVKQLFPEKAAKKAKDKTADNGAQLMKRKKNLESSLAKDRNQLKYQSKTKKEEESPMPAGPKRNKIEQRIKEKEKELDELNNLLNG